MDRITITPEILEDEPITCAECQGVGRPGGVFYRCGDTMPGAQGGWKRCERYVCDSDGCIARHRTAHEKAVEEAREASAAG